MILGTSELKNIQDHFTALNDYNIRGASVDLSISDKAYVKKDDKIIDLFELDSSDNGLLEDIYTEIDLAKGYELKPQNYFYTTSVEKVSIPLDMCGLVLARSTFARLGLILPISTYANPGYEGHLPIIIFNASNSIIKIPPYIRIMQLVLCEVKGEAKAYNDFVDSKYQNDKLTSPKMNDEEMDELLKKLKNE